MSRRLTFTVAAAVILSASTALSQSIVTVAGGGTNDGQPALDSGIAAGILGLANDARGNLYFSIEDRVRKVDVATGLLSTFAGTTSTGTGGDGGPADEAQLLYAGAIAFAPNGDAYIGGLSDRIRKVDARTGFITTAVGGGSSDDDGLAATETRVNNPQALAIDDAGNLYYVETYSNRVRRVDVASGRVFTFAGNGTQGNTGDTGPATRAQLDYPSGLATDVAGNLYVLDAGNNRVRRVEKATGVISNWAGSGINGFLDGPADQAQFDLIRIDSNGFRTPPLGLVIDSKDNVFVPDPWNGRVRRIDGATRRVTTFAGGGTDPVPGPATSMGLGSPRTISIDVFGNLFIVDFSVVYRVDARTGVLDRYAGFGEVAPGDGGPALAAILTSPFSMAFNSRGDFFWIDAYSGRIRAVDPRTGVVRRVVGGGSQRDDDVPALEFSTRDPAAVAVDGTRALYFSELSGNRVWRVDPLSGKVNAYAGTGGIGYSGDGGPATAATLDISGAKGYKPAGLVLDAQGNLFFTDNGNHAVRRIDAATRVITTYAGNGTSGDAGDGGPATQAQMQSVSALAFDTQANLVISDVLTENPHGGTRIRKVDRATGRISTIAGTRACTGQASEDIPALDACLGAVGGLAFDRAGNLFIAQGSVRKLDVATGLISTIAGGGDGQGLGDYGPPRNAHSGFGTGLGIRPGSDDLFIADHNSNRIRAIFACRTINAPALQTPAADATGVKTAPTLSWVKVDGAFAYDVYLDTASASTLLIGDLGATSYTPANLQPGATYRWRVVAKGDPYCPSQSIASSPIRSFTTAMGCRAPGAFSLTEPAAGSQIPDTSTILRWSSASGSATYLLYFGTSQNPPLLATASLTSLAVSSLVPGATYRWRIVARAACDPTLTTSSPVQSFQVVPAGGGCAAPGPFTLTQPSTAATSVPTSTQLQWTASPGATSYDLFLGTSTPAALHVTDLQATSLTVSGLFGGKQYYWRVKARTSCDSSKTFTSPEQNFSTNTECLTPGSTSIVFVPPVAVAAGQSYAIAWSPVPSLDLEGLYEVQRATDSSFTVGLESQYVETTAASFIAAQPGIYFHRVRAVAGCDPAKTGPWSEAKQLTITNASPNVVITVQPRGVISAIGQSLEDKKASFTMENISSQTLAVYLAYNYIDSLPFFTLYDPAGGRTDVVTLEPRVPKTIDLRFSGPPNNTPGSYQGAVYVLAAGSASVPSVFVNLKIGNEAGAQPELRIDGLPSEYAVFPGLDGDDSTRAPLTVSIHNPGTSPLAVAAEIGPEAWLEPEAGWNSQPIPAGASRDVKLYTRRVRAPNGSALPRYTYFTVRTRTGESARMLVQDNDIVAQAQQRASLGDARVLSYIVPDAVSLPDLKQVSRIHLTNVGSETVQTTLFFTPRDADGFDAARTKAATVIVPANDIVTLTDPVAQVFGASGAGQIEVRAAPERIGLLSVAASIVAANEPGQRLEEVPVLWRSEGTKVGVTHVAAGILSDSSRRTELVLVETSGVETVGVKIRLIDSNGTVMAIAPTSLGRYGQTVIEDVAAVLAGGASLSSARLEVVHESGGGSVVALAKIVDRASGEAAVLVAQPVVALSSARTALYRAVRQRPLEAGAATPPAAIIPFVSSGLFGTGSSTVVTLTSSLAAPAIVGVKLRAPDGKTSTGSITLPSGATIEFTDVLKEIFGLLPPSRGSLEFSLPPGVEIYSRSLAAVVGNGATSGTSQNPVFPFDSPFVSGAFERVLRPLFLDGLSQSIDTTRGSRWSLVVSELNGQIGTVVVRLYEAGNRAVPFREKSFSVGPNGQFILDDLFASMDLSSDSRQKDRTNVLCVVLPLSGRALVSAVAIEIDNQSGRARTLLFRPAGGSTASGTSLAGGQQAPPTTRKRPVHR